MSILLSIPLILFWAAVLAFVPSAIYLIINPLESIRAEKLISKNIFVLWEEINLSKQKLRRYNGVRIIYAACLVLMTLASLWNGFKSGRAGVMPFDILSTVSVVLFFFALLTYLPIVLYLTFKDPWRYKAEGAYLRRAFVGYGIGLLIFSVIYSNNWLGSQGLTVGRSELLSSLIVCVFGTAALSYLPTLAYVLIGARKRLVMSVRPSVVFAIFVIFFILFSGLYIYGWLQDQRAGVKYVPAAFFLEFK